VTATAPSTLELFGVGIDTAAALLVAAGDNPERLRSEAAWAHLRGVAPIQASSGRVTIVEETGGRLVEPHDGLSGLGTIRGTATGPRRREERFMGAKGCRGERRYAGHRRRRVPRT